MITLSQAFRLCQIEDKPVFLQAVDDRSNDTVYFNPKWIRNHMDMRKIKVIRIEPLFEKYGPDYLGVLFVVRGISYIDLRRISNDMLSR